MNSKFKMALSLVLLILCILILSLCVFLPGCGRQRNRVYTVPRINEHSCEDEIIPVTPPALIVTPSPRVRPWFPRRRETAVPVVPVEPGDALVVPQIKREPDAAEVIFAYASIDKPLSAAE